MCGAISIWVSELWSVRARESLWLSAPLLWMLLLAVFQQSVGRSVVL